MQSPASLARPHGGSILLSRLQGYKPGSVPVEGFAAAAGGKGRPVRMTPGTTLGNVGRRFACTVENGVHKALRDGEFVHDRAPSCQDRLAPNKTQPS